MWKPIDRLSVVTHPTSQPIVMTITQDQLKKLWTSLPADHNDLKDVKKYFPIGRIESAKVERELLCKECDEVVFIVGDEEIWATKARNGKMRLPQDVAATVYQGKYAVNARY